MYLKKKLKNAGRVIFFVNNKNKITIYFAFSSIFKILILLKINSKIWNFFKNKIWLSQNFSRFSKKKSFQNFSKTHKLSQTFEHLLPSIKKCQPVLITVMKENTVKDESAIEDLSFRISFWVERIFFYCLDKFDFAVYGD